MRSLDWGDIVKLAAFNKSNGIAQHLGSNVSCMVLTASITTYSVISFRKFQLSLLGWCTSLYRLSAYFSCASVAMSQQGFITPPERRNNTSRPFFVCDKWPILVQLMQQQSQPGNIRSANYCCDRAEAWASMQTANVSCKLWNLRKFHCSYTKRDILGTVFLVP